MARQAWCSGPPSDPAGAHAAWGVTPDPASDLRLCPACAVAWEEDDALELEQARARVATAA